jgi:hypothetical protein
MPVNPNPPSARRVSSRGSARGSGRGAGGRESASALVDNLAAKLQALERDVAELRIELAEGSAADDPLAAAGEDFASELRSLLGDAPIDRMAVRRAARLAAAEQAWVSRLGGMWDTGDVVAVLGVSKQRVSALVKQRRLIALPRGGRLEFPAWQFAGTSSADRACLAGAHATLVSDGGIDPWSAGSWLLTAHPELDDRDPVDWLRSGGDPERVLLAARRDAARAAQ